MCCLQKMILVCCRDEENFFFFLIPDFGVCTAILNTTDISHRWCKLNPGPLRGAVKSHDFTERIDARRKYFYFPHKFLGIIGRKRLGQPFWIIIWIYYYLLNGITLDLDLANFYWIRKMPNFATNNSSFSNTTLSLTY